MTKPIEVSGNLSSAGKKFAIIAGRFNGFVVESLVDGAVDAFVRTGAKATDITVYRAPGAWEIPQLLRRVVAKGGVDAVVCVGAVIRGSTPHFDYVSSAVARGIETVAMNCDIPVTFGVLTTDTIEQAIERSGTKAGNKGFESALAAAEMAQLFAQLS